MSAMNPVIYPKGYVVYCGHCLTLYCEFVKDVQSGERLLANQVKSLGPEELHAGDRMVGVLNGILCTFERYHEHESKYG